MVTSLQRSRHDPKTIIRIVSEFFRKPTDEVRGPRRNKTLVVPRHVSMFLIRRHSNLSLAEIGALFTDRDHTTVLHACRTVERLIESSDDILIRHIAAIETDLERDDDMQTSDGT